MRKVITILFIIALAQCWGFSVAMANSGYFLCTTPETLIDRALGIELGIVNYTGMQVTSLVSGRTSKRDTFLALNFTKHPYSIEAHHPESMYQSGRRVFRSRELKLLKSVTGTHSGATLYKTADQTGLWSMVSESGRALGDHLLPSRLNQIAQGAAYVLVGRKVALVGFAPKLNPALSFCIKQSDGGEEFSEAHIRAAYMQLMKDYNSRIKNNEPRDYSEFSFLPEHHVAVEPSQRVRLAEMLNQMFRNDDFVFRSQYGQILTMGAFLATTSLLTMRMLMRRSNVAMAILPPDIVDEFLTIGKVKLYTPEYSEITFKEIEDLFKNNDIEEIVAQMERDPQLEAYLYQLTIILFRQTSNPNEA